MYKNNDSCPICGEGKLSHKIKTEEFEYKRHFEKIEEFAVFICDFCEEEIVPEKTITDSEKRLRDFHREVDGLLTSKQIKKIRESYGFTQDDFSELLGLGKKTFARYENSTVTQSRTTDHLLRIIDVLPEALDVICGQKRSSSYYSFKRLATKAFAPADNTLVYKYTMGS